MAAERGKIRASILDYIKANDVDLVSNLAWGAIPQFLQEKGLPTDDPDVIGMVQEVFHELYLERIIITGSTFSSDRGLPTGSDLMCWPFYRLTEYGRKVLSQCEYNPYDPDGYLARLRSEVPKAHPDVIRYTEESLGCLRANYLLAASVMLGCAAEKGLLGLIEAFGNWLPDSDARADYEKDTKSWMISKKYDALWKRLEPMASDLPKRLGDDLHIFLDQVFNLIRTTRNDAGHPSGKVIERETVHANLILFPNHCRRIYGLIEHFSPS